MADFDAFGEDPAAEFLAREKEDLGGLVDETLGDGSGVTPSTGEGITEDIFGTTTMEEEPVSNNPYSAISQMDETPECILKWREEQNNLLREKDEEETEALKELRETARKELEDWYNHHEDTLKHAKDSNREAEDAFVQERDEDIPGHEWERVGRIVDFNPKNNKNTKDVSRMRSIFLQLKQTPPVH